MKLFYIFLGIISLNIILFITIYLSTIEIEVKRFFLDTLSKKNDFLIFIRLKFLDKVTWVRIKIDTKKIEKYKSISINNKFLKSISKKLNKNILSKDKISNLKSFKINFKNIMLEIKISLFDPITTSLSVAVVSTILSILLANSIQKYNSENCKYKIEPCYYDKASIKINLNCIISVKMVHIISIINSSLKKESVEKNGKSSDRRAYAYRNE